MSEEPEEQTMLTKAQTQPIRDLLQAAQWHFEDDEKRLGSQKIWDATVAALWLIAEERGWACEAEDDRWDIIERLHAEYPDLWLDAGYGAAQGHQDHASGIFMEEIEFILAVPAAVDFVEELLEIAAGTA